MKKEMIGLLAAAAMMLSLAACGSEEAPEEAAASVQPNTTCTGTVSAIDEASITVTTDSGDVVIELTDATTYSRGFGMRGQRPEGREEMPSDAQDFEDMGGETPPEMPEGMEDAGQSRPEMPDGEIPEGSFPEMPEGEAPEGGFSEMPEGEFDEDPEERRDKMEQAFSLTLGDIAVGDSVSVETDAEGKAVSVTVSGGQKGFSDAAPAEDAFIDFTAEDEAGE